MKTNLDQFFKMDDQASKEGVWLAISDETQFLVKPFKRTNPQIKKALEVHYKPYARQIEMKTLPADKSLEIEIKVFVHSCLVTWKGVEIEGEIKEYDAELAIELFKSLPELFDTLTQYAEDTSNYKEVVGNS
jgi:hypothetical protein